MSAIERQIQEAALLTARLADAGKVPTEGPLTGRNWAQLIELNYGVKVQGRLLATLCVEAGIPLDFPRWGCPAGATVRANSGALRRLHSEMRQNSENDTDSGITGITMPPIPPPPAMNWQRGAGDN